jgi:hypothetical protein
VPRSSLCSCSFSMFSWNFKTITIDRSENMSAKMRWSRHLHCMIRLPNIVTRSRSTTRLQSVCWWSEKASPNSRSIHLHGMTISIPETIVSDLDIECQPKQSE